MSGRTCPPMAKYCSMSPGAASRSPRPASSPGRSAPASSAWWSKAAPTPGSPPPAGSCSRVKRRFSLPSSTPRRYRCAACRSHPAWRAGRHVVRRRAIRRLPGMARLVYAPGDARPPGRTLLWVTGRRVSKHSISRGADVPTPSSRLTGQVRGRDDRWLSNQDLWRFYVERGRCWRRLTSAPQRGLRCGLVTRRAPTRGSRLHETGKSPAVS